MSHASVSTIDCFAWLRRAGAALGVSLLLIGTGWAQTSAITYQGKLTDAGNPANGNFDLQFALFDTPTVGTGVQQGAVVIRNPVAVSVGIFTVVLDFGVAVFGGADRYLEIGVRPAGSAVAYTILAPRQPITSSPYAIQTLNAQTLGGLPMTGFVQNTTSLQAGANFNIGGGGTATTLKANGPVSLGGAVPPAAAPAGEGRIYFDSASNKVKVSENGAPFVNLVGATGVSGSGTPDTIAVWSAGTTLGSATAITQSAAGVQLPNGVQLAVGAQGNQVQFGSPNGETGMSISGASGRADVRFDGTLKLVTRPPGSGPPSAYSGIAITSAGNVGVGTDTPGGKLDVRGNVVIDSGTPLSAIFTAGAGGEQNRYLGLLNSPTTVTASGLKVGGILVADSYAYANPGKNDVIVKGLVTIGTNASYGSRLNVISDSTANAIYAVGGTTGATKAGDAIVGVGGRSNSNEGGIAGVFYGGAGTYGGAAVYALGGNFGGEGVYGTGGDGGGTGVRAVGGVNIGGTGGGGLLARGGDSTAAGSKGGIGIFVNPGNGPAGPSSAGIFNGSVTVNGSVSKFGGSFVIDHPLDPANKFLYHSFVESPDMMNVYNGIAELDASGQAVVTLPGYFEALNRDFRYQLTSIRGYAPIFIADEVNANRFRIAGGTPGLKVSWQVTGIRRDAYANANRIEPEVDKPANERGHYLLPKLFGQPEQKGIEYVRYPELRQQSARQSVQRRPE